MRIWVKTSLLYEESQLVKQIRAYFDTSSGVVHNMQFRTVEEPSSDGGSPGSLIEYSDIV